MKAFFFISMFFIAEAVSAQNTIGTQHENSEGVIFCRNFYNEGYLKIYNVFDISPPQVKELEDLLREKGKPYPNYIRQYNGIRKNNKFYLVAQLIAKSFVDNDEGWRKMPIAIMDGCEATRTIIYDLEYQKIVRDQPGYGCED